MSVCMMCTEIEKLSRIKKCRQPHDKDSCLKDIC